MYTIKEMAKILDVSETSVSKAIKQEGVTPAVERSAICGGAVFSYASFDKISNGVSVFPRIKSRSLHTEKFSLYSRGWSDHAIASALGLSSRAVLRWRRQNKYPAHDAAIFSRQAAASRRDCVNRATGWLHDLRPSDCNILNFVTSYGLPVDTKTISNNVGIHREYTTVRVKALLLAKMLHRCCMPTNSCPQYTLGDAALKILEDRARLESPEEFALLQESLQCPRQPS